MIAELLTYYDGSSARDQYRDERPVIVKPRNEEAVVVLARVQHGR